jgi:hypothetical protein
LPSLNPTEKAILSFLFSKYPNKVKESTMYHDFKDNPDFLSELTYLVEKKLAQQFVVPSEGKWKGRFERLASMNYERATDAFSGKEFRITVMGIDALKENVELKPRQALTKQQITQSVPLPPTPKACPHKRKELVDIQPGSAQSVGGGIQVIRAERSKTEYLSFFRCQDCGEVFYKKIEKLE